MTERVKELMSSVKGFTAQYLKDPSPFKKVLVA
jgi:hypothetical protein